MTRSDRRAFFNVIDLQVPARPFFLLGTIGLAVGTPTFDMWRKDGCWLEDGTEHPNDLIL